MKIPRHVPTTSSHGKSGRLRSIVLNENNNNNYYNKPFDDEIMENVFSDELMTEFGGGRDLFIRFFPENARQ